MFFRFKTFALFAFLVFASISSVAAQESSATPAPNQPDKKEKKQNNKKQTGNSDKNATAEQVAESTIVIYGGLGGRASLNQIRKTTIERGKISVVNAEGKTEQANYERVVLRANSLDKERIRFNQEFPSAKFALVYSDDKIFGIFNDSVFTPREDATKAFQNQIWHGIEALLRYKENGSTLELAGREKMMNVDLYILDVTDKQKRKTRYYISSQKFHVKMLEYTEDNLKFRRKFYDYNYAQGTLVPYHTVLWADEKQVEETRIQTITFGQKVEENIFQGS
ncbi:MAG: hypothetical protein M3521_04730 [Acidobacteriota bacterium]|nr:hypothetical protein [Acidobacteriota bacterium]MDQ3373178.1 hypothetical protein [Acidobacteriota bacterium]